MVSDSNTNLSTLGVLMSTFNVTEHIGVCGLGPRFNNDLNEGLGDTYLVGT